MVPAENGAKSLTFNDSSENSLRNHFSQGANTEAVTVPAGTAVFSVLAKPAFSNQFAYSYHTQHKQTKQIN